QHFCQIYIFLIKNTHLNQLNIKENACVIFNIKNKFDLYLFNNIYSFHQNNKGE
ncbi:hypothetical protein GTS36_004658, partial [Salmonella enterica]|nr:hypothetical protein [Salmonella enterica]